MEDKDFHKQMLSYYSKLESALSNPEVEVFLDEVASRIRDLDYKISVNVEAFESSKIHLLVAKKSAYQDLLNFLDKENIALEVARLRKQILDTDN